MASLRTLSAVRSFSGRAFARSLSTRSAAASKTRGALLVGSAVAGLTSYGVYKWQGNNFARDDLTAAIQAVIKSPTVTAASPPETQPTVWTPGKNHALYLWIILNHTADVKKIAKVSANLQKMVDTVVDPALKDEDNEVVAGVGFGPNFFAQVFERKTLKNYNYTHRKGTLGVMPNTGGDILIHGKSNNVSKLFELSRLFLKSLPPDSVESFEDIYGFTYRNGRDLSGFLDGTENRADEEGRQEVAIEKETGGSYVVTQKWVHDFDVIHKEKTKTMESWFGREKADGTELRQKTITSHVARMTGDTGFQVPKPVEILRQSLPYGTMSGEAGLFILGYAADPYNFEYMLDKMVGAGGDMYSDDVMKLSKNTRGTYWYFPGKEELGKLS